MPAHPGHKPGPGRPRRTGTYSLRHLPPHLFTRTPLIEHLGIDEKKLRDLERRSVVQAVAFSSCKRALYDQSVVDKAQEFLREEEGRKARPPDHFNALTFKTEDSLAVYAGLRERKSLIDIALENKIDPRFVEVIATKYCKMGGAIMLDSEDMKKLNAKLASHRVIFDEEGKPIKPEPIATVDDLIEIIGELAQRVQRGKVCIRCRKAQRAEECEGCVIRKIEREIQKQMAASETPTSSNAADAAE